MTAFFLDYGLFLAKTVTFVIAAMLLLAFAVGLSKRAQQTETLKVEKLNEKYRNLSQKLAQAMSSGAAAKALKKQHKQERKAAAESGARGRTFLLSFKGDIKASAVASLREEVSAVLAVARDGDEVLLRLENPGGIVHEHGLAAAQLTRIREAGLPLVVAVDKVAASGGYLMACVASRIVAAPFAVVGSVGVIAQLPNFNRLLDERGIEFEQIMAGKHKRTVTMFGKNTDADRAKLKEELEDVHQLFKQAIARYRPALDLDRIATGEHWYGTRALELGLIDEIATSDELLMARLPASSIYAVTYEIKEPLPKKLMHAVDSRLARLVDWLRGSVGAVARRW